MDSVKSTQGPEPQAGLALFFKAVELTCVLSLPYRGLAQRAVPKGTHHQEL